MTMNYLDRRGFLVSAAALAVAQARPIPITDTHIHLFDQTRPQGTPHSGGNGNTQPSFPARYRKLAKPLGVVGAIEVEASPWIEDNLWVLEVEQKDTIMVGAIGNLQPENLSSGNIWTAITRRQPLGLQPGETGGQSGIH
jgi:predicted TIM-barrel fold metal-dependent hydrolase